MNITKDNIFRGCLFASIAHAVMTNIYPEFSYEQSWDGLNYSIQNSSGLRGTITFENDYCVGAVRNDELSYIVGENCIREYMDSFPLNVANKATEEALQYLLLEYGGIVGPCITSVFWADSTTIHYDESCSDNIQKDFTLFDFLFQPEEKMLDFWAEYYDMDSNTVELINDLYLMKEKDFFSEIKLSEEQKMLIPGCFINDECIESLKELNIFI